MCLWISVVQGSRTLLATAAGKFFPGTFARKHSSRDHSGILALKIISKRSHVSSESPPGGKFCAQPPKGKYYASNRNYILDLCRDGALEWRLKKEAPCLRRKTFRSSNMAMSRSEWEWK